MRVLHVTDTYLPRRGGIELHVHDLAQAQRREGDEADVLTLTRSRSVAPVQSAGTLLRPDDDADLVRKLRFVLAHRRHGRDAGYDVVHAHCSTFSPLVFATLAAADIPTAVTFHSLWRRYTRLAALNAATAALDRVRRSPTEPPDARARPHAAARRGVRQCADPDGHPHRAVGHRGDAPFRRGHRELAGDDRAHRPRGPRRDPRS